MATINLGAIKFNWKGAYNSGTTYAVDDVVSSGGNSYVCIQAHSNQAVGNATAYWNIMSSAGTNGTNGTDLTTTLTTQGDIVYRDGSGLQRLGAGTSGQVLQTGGTGANPSWGTVSSDFVKIGSTTTSGNATAVTLDIFNDTYKNYVVYINDLTTSAGDQVYMKFRSASGDMTNSTYRGALAHPYRNTSGGIGMDNHSQWNDSFIKLAHNGLADNNAFGGQYVLTFPNPRSTRVYKSVQIHNSGAFSADESQMDTYIGSAVYMSADTTALTGFHLYLGGGYIVNGATISYYGIK